MKFRMVRVVKAYANIYLGKARRLVVSLQPKSGWIARHVPIHRLEGYYGHLTSSNNCDHSFDHSSRLTGLQDICTNEALPGEQ